MIYLLSQLVDRAADANGGASGDIAERDAFRVPGTGLPYGALVEQSNRLAHLLRAEGVRRGDRVGILMPRALESAVAVYGILKAGAAFVPIDPRIPAGGLSRLIEDCGIRHLTVHPDLDATLERIAGRARLDAVIGTERTLGTAVRTLPWTALEGQPADHAPAVTILEDDLAYLMYSSGSTGRPKGIMHTHRSGLAYARLSVHTYDVGPADRIGNHSPLHFDMSTFGYFSSPLAGATTVLIPEAYTKLAASLSQLMAAERLTIWYSVPLALIQLLTRGVLEARDLSSLRWVLFGGEPFARKHLHALMAAWPQARFSNVYGPAEVNQCTYYHLPRREDGDEGAGADQDLSEPVPIGRVWENTEALIVSAEDAEVADGEAGELLIRSPTMMQGYWGRPELTARAFYRRRAAGIERVYYRSGDLVRTTPDGDMVFLGRKDRQLKVRGYRVELDEIERTIASFPGVEEAGVFPVRVDGEVHRLEAAVTPAPGTAVDVAALEAHLADLLSWYAVPAAIAVVDVLPRTTSGKIDRRRLQTHAESAIA